MPTENMKPDTRQTLLMAAEATIINHGLRGFKARSIAETAKCSLGSIYHHFPSLDDLLLRVNERTLNDLDAALTRATAINRDGTFDPALELRALALAYLEFAADHGGRWRAISEHHLPDEASVPQWYADAQTRVFQHLHIPLAVLQPGLSNVGLAEIVRIVFAAVHGVITLGLDEKLEREPLKALRSQVRICIDLLAQGLQHYAALPPSDPRPSEARRPGRSRRAPATPS